MKLVLTLVRQSCIKTAVSTGKTDQSTPLESRLVRCVLIALRIRMIMSSLSKLMLDPNAIQEDIQTQIQPGQNPSIVRLCSDLITLAYAAGSSDLHICPDKEGLRVCLRVDGVLSTRLSLPYKVHEELIARFKILAGLRTDEHAMAQDGRFRHKPESGTWIDIRISIAPTYHGENAVLRLFASSLASPTLNALGFSAEHEILLTQAIQRAHGMLLVTGPTGSGKTTTLYALMQLLSDRSLALVTIEDPIEYSLPGTLQMAANRRSGFTFQEGLRSILRQDPDVIMVGEIRDSETADLSIHAALTGHLVLSTLHTSDAPMALPRLMDLKIEPYLIASTVSIVVAQRLVRRICTACRKKEKLPAAVHKQLCTMFGRSILEEFSIGAGCNKCNGTGYQGRVGLYEILHMDAALETALIHKATSRDLRTAALGSGMIPLISDGLAKAASGLTSIEEVLRVSHDCI